MNCSKLVKAVQYSPRTVEQFFKSFNRRPICGTWKTIPEFSIIAKGFATTPNLKSKKETPTEFNIYVGPLTKQIRNVKVFSLLTSATGVLSQPLIFQKANELGTTVPALVAVCSIVGFFTFVTPLLLHLVTRKYITSVGYNPYTNSYKAITYSIFIRPKEVEFKPGEMTLLNTPSMFGNVALKGQPLFLDARFFDDLDHYKKIMGFDKPMDFKLGKSVE